MPPTTRTAARILVDQLEIHAVDTIFCALGESYLTVLDALYDAQTIKQVSCRQEGGAAFDLQGGRIPALYPRTELAKDAAIPLVPPIAGEFSIGHAVASKAAVDALLAQAAAAGAALTDQHHDRPWGIYSGYFRDLDGHLWEVLWNPELEDI